jgi:hypothetical protein
MLGTQCECIGNAKNKHPHPPPKEKTLDPIGVEFLRWRIFSIQQFFSKNLLNIPFFQKNRLKATKKIFKITMFSHIVQQKP